MRRDNDSIHWDRGRSAERTSFRGHHEQINLVAYRRRKRLKSWLRFVPLWAAAVGVGTAYGAGWLDLPTRAAATSLDAGAGAQARFSMCHVGGGYNCVVDGDTIWLEGEKIRIADIDTPETHEPRCAAEKALGDRATRRLQQILGTGTVTLQRIERDQDRYGRKLRIVLVDGTSVGETLVGEGLARWYGGSRRPWC
jgi:micrococcal nuclease